MVLRWMCGEGAIPQGSVVLLRPDADPVESEIWAAGKGWTRGKGARIIQETPELIAQWLDECGSGTEGA